MNTRRRDYVCYVLLIPSELIEDLIVSWGTEVIEAMMLFFV